MATRQIPPVEWTDFFTDFSERYEGWTIEVETPGKQEDPSAPSELTLDSVTFETENGERSLTIGFAGAEPLRIVEPSRVSLEEIDESGEEAIEIESPSETVRLRLRFPMQEEMFDLE
jgi:hypothetical protein